MAAYVITEIDVTDPVGYEEYRRMGPPTVAAYGGKFVVWGGKVEVLEGTWVPKCLVVLEFKSVERAKMHVNVADGDAEHVNEGWGKFYWTPWRRYLER